MRLARLRVEGVDLVALEHREGLYRVDQLDRVLGAPVPEALRERAGHFATRVFAMGGVGLEEHEAELLDGTLLDDCRLDRPALAGWLPPWGEAGSLLELDPDAELPRVLGGRGVRGHATRAPGLVGGGRLLVTPALALIVGDDLHLPSPGEVRRSVLGVSLALVWRSPDAARRGFERLPGTHLGPWLVVPAPAGELVLSLTRRTPTDAHPVAVRYPVALGALVERAAAALTTLAQHQDVVAGDAVLALLPEAVEVAPGEPVILGAEGLGELRGQVG